MQGVYLSPRAALQQGSGRSATDLQALAASFSRVSISHAVAASPPDVAALLVFEELAHMTRVGGQAGQAGRAGRAGGQAYGADSGAASAAGSGSDAGI